MDENAIIRKERFFEKDIFRNLLKILGISLLVLSPFILFLLTLLIPASKINNLAIKLGVNNIVGKYYKSDFYGKAFKFVNEDRLSCTKDGKDYFIGEYYFTDQNCFMCVCIDADKFNCISNSGNTNPYCLTLPDFIPVISNQKQTSSSPEILLTPPPLPDNITGFQDANAASGIESTLPTSNPNAIVSTPPPLEAQ